MSEHDRIVERIARLAGIAESHTDAFGNRVEISAETRRGLLDDFALNTDTEASARASLARIERLRQGFVPALIPALTGAPIRVPTRLAASDDARWRITDESGATREGRAVVRSGPDGAMLDLPALDAGYHRLRISTGAASAEATIIAAPARCFLPRELREGVRLWGATAQVYGLRSSADLGIGGYREVGAATAGAGALGASFLGLSPVHALFGADRTKYSPYSPSSRLFLETIFIDPTGVEGFAGSEAAGLLESPNSKERIAALHESALVDYEAVWQLKRPLFDALWTGFRDSGGSDDFEAFRRSGGEALESHATFEALSEHFRAENRFWVGEWPDLFKDASGAEVRRFRTENAERVAFHAWLQWLADSQLAEAARQARASGMSIGLYRDLAVGADRSGSEIWAAPERYAAALSVGAPPDPLGPQGQNWGLPPFDPLMLEAQGLAAFRAIVVANMRHAGAIRIDHAYQLRRLFLIPPGLPAAQGAYVEYPFEAMLAVLRLESERARCIVIAEDLGTAPEGFSDSMMASGLLSYRVLPFEREPDGAFKLPEAYPARSLAVLTTHDLPTFRGWWRGLDIDLRQTLGVFDQDTAERERDARQADRHRLSASLASQKLLASPEPPADPPLEAALRYLGRTSSVLTSIQLEDASGELNQANLPGVEQGHPNWRRRLSNPVEAITASGGDFAKLAAALGEEGRGLRSRAGSLASPPPRATYRLQFHKDFTFADAAAIVPYLANLGISHLYSSPIHKARPGSTHGYDIVDHAAINPELGGEEGFRHLSDTLKAHGLGLILDIVPNHMGVGGADNGWWLSALEWGELSPYSRAFDIDWERLGAHHKLVVPFLGDRYGEALERGELKLSFDPNEGSFSVWHWEHRFPICPLAYPIILDRALAALEDIEGHADLIAVSERLRIMNEETSPERRAGFPEEAEGLKQRLAQAAAKSPELRRAIDHAVTLVNGAPGLPDSFGTLHRILEAQSYRLAHWRVAASDINFRRFFDINSLGGMRIENPEVFQRTHAMVFDLVREGRIDGLRIDHIDGLADPEGYARALQAEVGPGFYVVVEKILEPGEDLRPWPVAGTTGYDVLNLIDGVFVDTRNADAFERIYRSRSDLEGSYGFLLRQAKTEVLEASFASELEVLVSDLKRIADADRRTRDYTVYAMRHALTEIVAQFPVYRTYLGDGEPSPEDRQLVESTVERAKRSSALPDRTVHDFAAAALLGAIETEGPGRPAPDHLRRFRRRFQQLTGPVMAKSLEDTLFYRYGRLISLNEVGGDPGHFGLPLDAFHSANAARMRAWPDAMIATATHDTKRGEDARARLNALSEMPQNWAAALETWEGLVEPYLVRLNNETAPDGNDRVILLQALLGAWPLELLDGHDEAAATAFRERMEGYVTKALREAKRHTSWVNVNDSYENATLGLVRGLLDGNGSTLDPLRPLARRLSHLGMLNGLSRTILKCTLPGVPDTYRGTEFWDFSLVDPDNRRPVDYAALAQGLEDDAPAEALLQSWQDGRIKQRVLTRLIADRAEAPLLYSEGEYRALAATGSKARHALAFLRSRADQKLLVVVPRLIAGFTEPDSLPLGPKVWGDTSLPLPAGRWRNVLTGAEIETSDRPHPVGELFSALPIAVLRTLP